MKILHIIPSLCGGGAERQCAYLAPELVRMGHEVHLAYSTSGPSLSELPGVALHQLKSRSNYDPYLLWQLFRLVRRVAPDIIHTWILQMDILGGIAAKICRTPWIFREASSEMAYSSNWKSHFRVLAAWGANAIVSNSQGGDNYWKSKLPNSSRFIVPNGLPLQDIKTTIPATPSQWTGSQAAIVLYVGRLRSDQSGAKNLKFLLSALARVREKHEIQGVLCGEGRQRSELEKLSRDLGLEANVHFTGHLPSSSVWALMKKASVFVSLSAYEGCPNTVMEAMACGCPLVLSDIPGHREILDDNCALFVNPTDVQQTADSIVQTLCDAKAAKERALNAEEKQQKCSISEMAHNYEDIYGEVISRRNKQSNTGK